MALSLALLIDRLFGDPDWLWRRVPHPVVGLGWLIGRAEWHLNRPDWSERRRRLAGTLAILALLLLAVMVGAGIQALFRAIAPFGLVLEAVVASIFIAQKSLADHVERVERALDREGLEGGRTAVSMIVGRDPDGLDESGVCRAAIESLAENASDGVVAPWFFYALFGLPGLLAYKMLNTADSMIGHMDDRRRAFGWASARLDDLANLAPARLSAALFALSAGRYGFAAMGRAWAVARRDAPHHRSPNAGWPEGAMAGALRLALGGPRRYGELEVDAPFLGGEGRHQAGLSDIARGLRVFRRFCDLLLVATLGLAIVFA
ncbi:adenosylcobinamide-phosphate synthase CbiB [Aureimonas jatrophae]|uniref:adenosylcobinamide-phosphate synthase CbiB n=1 Tax=Aureimonas jatrophae TaxID=1166073 RepID=UPI001FCCF563|nr:adenosylcobinamide-phosphate synthase CbiB [Aureimonas jatrophae]